MKKILIIISCAIATLSHGQNLKSNQLDSIQVIGIRVDNTDPLTRTEIKCDDYRFLPQDKDPFFILDKTSPSIYSQSDNGQGNGYSYMRMRGLDQTRINFNLNGIPLNEMEDQGIYFSNMPGFYNYISNVSVQRGVGTSKFGQTSVGGSVNMETKNIIEKSTEINFLVRSNLPNDQYYNFYYSPGIDKNGFSYQIGGTWQKNQGVRDHSNNDGGSTFYGIESIKKSNIFKFYGFNGISHNQLAFYGVPDSLLKINYNTNLNLTSDKDTFSQNFACFNWINFKDQVKFNTSSYFSNVSGHYNSVGTTFGVNSYQYGIMSNLVYKNSTNCIFNIGINGNIYKRYHYGSDNNGYYDYPINTREYHNTGEKEDIISFIKVNQLSEELNIFFDLQGRSVWLHTPFNNTYNWIFLNPKFGFKFNEGWNKIHCTIGFTQREPTRTDMIQDVLQKNNIQYGNPDNTIWLYSFKSSLKPEKVTNVEVGNSFSNKILNLNLNCYFMTIENEFISTGTIDPYSGFMWKKSVQMTFRTGIESDGNLKLNNFSTFYTINYQYARLNDSIYTKNIPYNPDFIGTIGISYKINKISIGLYDQYVSSMAMDYNIGLNQHFSKEYSILNGYTEYQFKNINIGFRLNNILNQKIYIPAGFTNIPTYYVGQLQNWSINIRCKF